MERRRLRNCGHGRRKAFLGADGAIMGAATLAAAAMQAAATNAAAKQQASAIKDSANIQSQSIKQQTENNTNLQKESINFTRQQNEENRRQQQDIQTTLQTLAGQENMNSRMERNKVAVKYGGRPKHRRLSYGGAPFTVTDGGGVIPLNVDDNGYGLYEIYGNDHEHYHKTKHGKAKTGVGFKFSDGSVVEGEGNQNSNTGEKLFVTPNDALFISKHSIDGFNPGKAVDEGMNPVDAFNVQESIKAVKGYNDDGTKKRRRLRNAASLGTNIIINDANQTQYPSNGTGLVAGGVAYSTSRPVERIASSVRSLKNGGRVKAEGGYWQNYGGATLNTGGNLLGSAITILGNNAAARTLGRAYSEAGETIANAYRQMHGIDMSAISREDYAAPHAMAVIRSADTNINPQLERLRRNASAERRLINRGTLSSAARQQRLAGINDRMYQRMSEAYAVKHNEDEKIKQANAGRISQTSQFNAQQDLQASQQYGQAKLNLLQYNNDIENRKIAGIAEAQSGALTQSAQVDAQTMQANTQSLSNALTGAAGNFASTTNQLRTEKNEINAALLGADPGTATNYYATQGSDKDARKYYDVLMSRGNYQLAKVIAEARGWTDDFNNSVKDKAKFSSYQFNPNDSMFLI